MSARPRRLLPPVAGRTHVERLELQQFARKLHALMKARGLSNSGLARLIWGEVTDSKGYKVAKNRDRIGVYLRAEGLPEPRTLTKMAEVFEIDETELAPDVTAATVDREQPELAMTMVAGHTDKVHLQVNALVPLRVATQIIALIEQSKTDRTNADDNTNAPTQ